MTEALLMSFRTNPYTTSDKQIENQKLDLCFPFQKNTSRKLGKVPVPCNGTAEFRDGFYEVKIPTGKSSFFCFVFFEEAKKMKRKIIVPKPDPSLLT
ncbi:hypothetical protein DZC72_05865 [Maribacter algicola]|uniref:Uncharacterized protein n=1 Tax=Maribacter algicola TaxID=2498892 RepID=A0A426RM48_9FLAO|nr:hypothetical protein DZC72_05865 [Maribacter algicola]